MATTSLHLSIAFAGVVRCTAMARPHPITATAASDALTFPNKTAAANFGFTTAMVKESTINS